MTKNTTKNLDEKPAPRKGNPRYFHLKVKITQENYRKITGASLLTREQKSIIMERALEMYFQDLREQHGKPPLGKAPRKRVKRKATP